jgi:hypothetical protein
MQKQKKNNTRQKIDQGVCGITYSLVSRKFASQQKQNPPR